MVTCGDVAPIPPGAHPRRRRAIVVSFVLAAFGCGPAPFPAGPAGEPAAAAPATRGPTAGSPVETPFDVRLDGLPGRGPAPDGPARNPFRFASVAAPPPASGVAVAGAGPAGAPVRVDGWRPAGDPAALRFIGVLEAPESAGRVAVLTDGAGVYHGRVGDVVGGRWRIVALDRAAVVLERSGTGERLTLTPGGG